MIRIFIGYDPREAVAFSVLAHSIYAQASRPTSVAPLMLSQLQDILTRPRDPLQSTDFTYSRFLVPFLCGYEGWAIFMDCDMLLRDDIARLWDLRDENFAVQVVKHDFEPKETQKFLKQVQTKYQKKNWSSVMLFNNARCKALTPDYVNQASGLELHQFKWLETESLIGGLPRQWNYLVGYDQEHLSDPSLVHYTTGGPYFREFEAVEYSEDWQQARQRMLAVIE